MSAQDPLAPTLICFAVSREAMHFRRMVRGRNHVHVLVTGMGANNAARAVRASLKVIRPSRVFTCGFAGALNPVLKIGDVVFAIGTPPQIAQRLQSCGARQVVVACAERVVITAAEKCTLRAQTNADVVEMESAIIERVCREAGVECITVRAVSDAAQVDLPLDFNALMTSDQKLNPIGLAIAILRRPQIIPPLLQLGKNSALAGRQLARTLMQII